MAYVPRNAKHEKKANSADIDDLAITTGKLAADAVTNAKLADNAVESANIKDSNVTGAKLLATDDFNMGTLETTGKIVAAGGIATKQNHHTGLLIADLTAAFGDPAGLDNGKILVYKNDTDSKIYFVTVMGSAFYVAEATAAAAA